MKIIEGIIERKEREKRKRNIIIKELKLRKEERKESVGTLIDGIEIKAEIGKIRRLGKGEMVKER